jgi:hypothetical protein
MADLNMKNYGTETTSYPATPKVYFVGNISQQRNFLHLVRDWYLKDGTQNMFEDCKHLPVDTNRRAILEKNPMAMGRELMQAGAEITLSARFSQNALLPVLHCSHTMRPSPETIATVEVREDVLMDISTFDWTFGDSFIIRKQDRFPKFQPDIVLKTNSDEEQEVRMVGELKTCATVSLHKMVSLAIHNMTQSLFGILGKSQVL